MILSHDEYTLSASMPPCICVIPGQETEKRRQIVVTTRGRTQLAKCLPGIQEALGLDPSTTKIEHNGANLQSQHLRGGSYVKGHPQLRSELVGSLG